ncbi:hypothetical protein [Ruminiclostridium cellobioparum]|uniref:hypothetical protein n=1 Tax=Ruminiclostridium cellobioparum TaxID=29355 RepID=UPI0028A66E3E|nr:hypothetical protein [Ruminiclostridium cellobioparum]
MSKHEILTPAGKISAITAELKTKEEYKKFEVLHLEDISNAKLYQKTLYGGIFVNACSVTRLPDNTNSISIELLRRNYGE